MAKILMFRTLEKMMEHFYEHGEETKCDSAEEYLIKANELIQNPESVSKYETDEDDNDRIYYLSKTGEIVFVSTDGYIRTYFVADDEYYEQQ